MRVRIRTRIRSTRTVGQPGTRRLPLGADEPTKARPITNDVYFLKLHNCRSLRLLVARPWLLSAPVSGRRSAPAIDIRRPQGQLLLLAQVAGCCGRHFAPRGWSTSGAALGPARDSTIKWAGLRRRSRAFPGTRRHGRCERASARSRPAAGRRKRTCTQPACCRARRAGRLSHDAAAHRRAQWQFIAGLVPHRPWARPWRHNSAR